MRNILFSFLLIALVGCGGGGGSGQPKAGSDTPADSEGILKAIAIVSGGDSGGFTHTCALLSDGTIRCWGDNLTGQLGNGTTADSTTPVPVTGITTATAVSAQGLNTCVLLSDGTIRCWGNNFFGQLGNGTTADSSTPVVVKGITTATAVSVGNDYTCALLSNGTIQCWGQGGSSSTETCGVVFPIPCSSTPVPVPGITTARGVSAGSANTCALLSNRTIQCWDSSTTPVLVSGITTAMAVSANAGGGGVLPEPACALLSDGTIQCWGGNGNENLQLGNGAIISFTPVSVPGITTATAVSVGYVNQCTLLSDGTIQCWGHNSEGQLGNGTTVDSFIPVSVTEISTAIAVSVGRVYSCALLSDGTIQCWGSNSSGQLGNGTTVDSSIPVSVVGF